MSKPVKIYEGGPRDGLQNEKAALTVQDKITFIDLLAQAGCRYIEAGAFVSPKWVPQMAGTADIFKNLDRKQGVTYAALVPNVKGMDMAIASNVTEIAVFAAASETFSQKNINATIDESFERFAPVIDMAKNHDITVRGYVSCIAGCPYEGDIAPSAIADVCVRLNALGCYEISLGDTIGAGTPDVIDTVLKTVLNSLPAHKIALHCHDTRGHALDNIRAGLDNGVYVFDASTGGLGGCPYAPGASGNVATEAVVAMLHDLGHATDIDLNGLNKAAQFITKRMRETNHV